MHLSLYQIIASFPWYLPALTEKALVLSAMAEWDQALDTSQRVLDVEHHNIEALKV